MNSGKRWAYHFVSELECVKCRRKGDLTLYDLHKSKVDSEAYTPWELKEKVPHMDVWCSQCPPKINTRVTGEGRMRHKLEAARLADIRMGTQIASHYDTYRLHEATVSRQELVDYLKMRPCGLCEKVYPPYVMVVYHALGPFGSMEAFLDHLDTSVVVCRNCEAFVRHGATVSPNIVLDENFWNDIGTL